MNAQDDSSKGATSDPTTPTTEGDDTKSTEPLSSTPSKMQRICRKLIFLPYFVGIVWTCLHPVVSVLTGEPKCRGWYLDEHSIEIKFAEISTWQAPSHLKVSLPSMPQGHSTLCALLNDNKSNVSCHVHGDYFSMATITPLSNALDPVEEALVLVVPAPPQADWTTSLFHYTLMNSLDLLADPVKTPWLAKTMILVAPNEGNSLDDAVSSFLDAYLGTPLLQQGAEQSSLVPPLPPKLSGALLRTLIAVDVDDQSDKSPAGGQVPKDRRGRTEFAVLPQGRRGVLPNMDMVFLIGKLFTRTMFLSTSNFPGTTFLTHGYANESKAVSRLLDEQQIVGPLDAKTKKWAQELADMGLFAYTMAMGPYPAHATALDRGIDSITIKAKFEGTYFRDPSSEIIEYLEYLVRALSNLHERLHHSFTLYLLPTHRAFVSHMEYFLPNILILLPLAVRGFGLVLWEVERLDLRVVGLSILTTITAMGLSSIAFEDTKEDISMANTWLVCLYVAIVVVWKTFVLSGQPSKKRDGDSSSSSLKQEAAHSSTTRALQSLQFISCVTAAYILVPIAFAHTSLSYVPSLLWTPLLAFPNYSKASTRTVVNKLLGLVLLVVTAPPILLLPRVFGSYTAFLQFAYIPLHIQLLLLVATSWLS